MPHFGEPRNIPPEHQSDAILNQNNPLSGSAYTVLDTIRNAEILGVAVRCTWTVQPDSLEIIVTVDGHVLFYTQGSPVNNTFYYPINDPQFGILAGIMTTAFNLQTQEKPFIKGRSITIEARVNGGTVSNLYAIAKWARY